MTKTEFASHENANDAAGDYVARLQDTWKGDAAMQDDKTIWSTLHESFKKIGVKIEKRDCAATSWP